MSKQDPHGQFQDWLGAYADGELSGERQAWFEAHLAGCLECQRELVQLRSLSSLLRANPLPAQLGDANAHARQIVHQLPEKRHAGWQAGMRAALRYAPLGLFGLWAFAQTVLLVSGALVLLVGFTPLRSIFYPLTSGTVTGEGAAASWLSMVLGLSSWLDLPGALSEVVETAAWLSPLGLLNLVMVFVFAALFAAWLAGLWSHHRAGVTE